MGLSQKLSALKERAERQLDVLNSTEKTKNALLLPFFEALGYDPFDVREVEPEYPVDSEGEGSETVDYALRVDGAPAMLFECMEATADLDAEGKDLISRRVGDLPASLAVLTNGIDYRFFANLGGGKGIDERPFVEFNLVEQDPGQVAYLKRLTEGAFDTRKVLSAAFELKYTRRLESYLAKQGDSTDEHFVRFLAAQVYDGEVSESVLKHFRPVVQRLLQELEMEKHEIPPQVPSRQDSTRHSEPASQPADSAQSDAPAQTESSSEAKESSSEAKDKSRTDETRGPDAPNSPEEETADLDAHLQRAPAGLSDNGKQGNAANGRPTTENEATNDEVVNSGTTATESEGNGSERGNAASETSESPGHDGAPQSVEGDPQVGQTENGQPEGREAEKEEQENEDLEGKQLEGKQSEDELSDGGGGIAQEFANKVIGDS